MLERDDAIVFAVDDQEGDVDLFEKVYGGIVVAGQDSDW